MAYYDLVGQFIKELSAMPFVKPILEDIAKLPPEHNLTGAFI